MIDGLSTSTSMKISLAPSVSCSLAIVSAAHRRRSFDVPLHRSLNDPKESVEKMMPTRPLSTFLRRRSFSSMSCWSKSAAVAAGSTDRRAAFMFRAAVEFCGEKNFFMSARRCSALASEPAAPAPSSRAYLEMSKRRTSAPWKKERYRSSRRAMNGLPRSGSPMMMRTWRTPSVPAVAAIGGGTAVGIGLFDVGLSRCAFDSSYTSVSLLPRFDMRSTGGGEGSEGAATEGAATSSSGGRSDESESIRSTSFSLSSTLLLILERLTRRARLTR